MNKLDMVKTSIVANAPKILTGIGIFGMFGTTVVAVNATPKALRLIEDKKREMQVEKLPPIEVAKVTWKCYIPAFLMCMTSTVCLIKANDINLRRNAAIATAYNLSSTALKEYQDKVRDTLGEKKERVIREEISKDQLEKDPVNHKEVIVTEKGNTLCYDGVFGRYFRSDIDEVKRAITRINRKIVTSVHGYASLNDFYDELGLEHVEIGNDLGWNIDDGEIDIDDPYVAPAADGTPCLVIRYNVAPKRDFWKRL